MSDAMHVVFANRDALAAEVQRLRAALAVATQRVQELEADLKTQEECNYLAEYRQAVARAEAAEAQLELVDEYGRYCHDSAQPGDEQLPWPYTSFADWLAQQSEARP